MMMILTGPLLQGISGYFRDVWRKNLPVETVFGNIVISLMRNFRRAMLVGLISIQVVAVIIVKCEVFMMMILTATLLLRMSGYFRDVSKRTYRRRLFLNHGNQSHEKFPKSCLEVHSFRWLLVIIVKCEVFIMMILTGPLLLSISGYFRDVWRKNLPGETVFWNIVIQSHEKFPKSCAWRLIHSGGCL